MRLASNLPSSAIECMQKGFGRDTLVTLPSGHQFDTNRISKDNAHHNNNRLAGTGSVDRQDAAPGMIDRLHPNYTSMTSDFVQASRSGNTLARQMIQAALPTVTTTASSNSTSSSPSCIVVDGNDQNAATTNDDNPEGLDLDLRAYLKDYAMTGRDGDYFGEYEFQEYDRQKLEVPPEFVDPESNQAWRLKLPTIGENEIGENEKDDEMKPTYFKNQLDHDRKQQFGHVTKTTLKTTKKLPSKKQQHSKPYQKFDLFSHPDHKKTGKQRMYERMTSRNAKNMHLGKKRNRSEKKERSRAMKIDAGMRTQAASPDKICVTVANAVGVSNTQLSQYVNGELEDTMGNLFCSQRGLDLAADFVLHDSDDSTDDEK